MTDTLRIVSIVDAVADGLRKAIFNGDLEPGAPLTEALLSRRFDVPRPTVRSAVQLVMHDGLLRREPNRSVFVPVLDAADIEDLFSVRRMVEIDAVRRLVLNGVQPTAALRAQRMLESLDETDGWDDVVTHDFELHEALVDATGSPRLSRIYASIATEVRLALTQLRPVYTSPTEIAREHRSLLDAICSNDQERAIAAAREHLDTSEQIVLDQLSRRAEHSTGLRTPPRRRTDGDCRGRIDHGTARSVDLLSSTEHRRSRAQFAALDDVRASHDHRPRRGRPPQGAFGLGRRHRLGHGGAHPETCWGSPRP